MLLYGRCIIVLKKLAPCSLIGSRLGVYYLNECSLLFIIVFHNVIIEQELVLLGNNLTHGNLLSFSYIKRYH